MLVTFKTDNHANVILFGDIAITLLKMMGHSGTVPSAIQADDVPAALDRLTAAVNKTKTSPDDDQETDEDEPAVSLRKRALPLIDLLESAAKSNSDVMWSGN